MGFFGLGKKKQIAEDKQEEVKKVETSNKEGENIESNTTKVELQDNGFPKKSFDLLDTTDKLETLNVGNKAEDSSKVDPNKYLTKEDTKDNTTGKSTIKVKPLMSYITVKKSENEGDLIVRVKRGEVTDLLTINEHSLNIRKDAENPKKPYRIIGSGNSITVNADELDFIYTRFKNIN